MANNWLEKSNRNSLMFTHYFAPFSVPVKIFLLLNRLSIHRSSYMSITDKLARQFLKQAIVLSKKELSEGIFHLIIKGQDLVNLTYLPGQHLRVFVGMDMDVAMSDKVRTYSVWRYDNKMGIMDLMVCTHANGPGSLWANELREGEEIYFTSPKGKFTLDLSAQQYLFIGDITTLAHFYEIKRNLPTTKHVKGILYADHIHDLVPDLDGSFPFEFYELPPYPLEQLKALLDKELPLDTNDCMVYVGGDGRVCVELLRHLKKTKGMNGKNIKVKPFWMPGKKGLE